MILDLNLKLNSSCQHWVAPLEKLFFIESVSAIQFHPQIAIGMETPACSSFSVGVRGPRRLSPGETPMEVYLLKLPSLHSPS